MSSATEPTAAANGEYIALLPLTYTGPVPQPQSPCTDPTPDEQVRAALREKEEQLKQKEAEQKAKDSARTNPPAAADASNANSGNSTVQQLKDGAAEALDGLRSLVSQLSLSVEMAATDVNAKAHSQARALNQQQGYDRFASYFGEDLVKGQGEVLLADYSCAAMHNGTRVEGHLFITRNYLCFAASFGSVLKNAADAFKQAVKADYVTHVGGEASAENSSIDTKVVGIKQVIPLKTVACLVKSVALPTVEGGAPYFLPLPADYVVASALQVYEKEDKKLFQFLGFDSFTAKAGSALSSVVKGTPLDRAYNYIDHAWREAVKVPVDGVQYA